MKKYFLSLYALVCLMHTIKAQTVQYLPLYTDNDLATRTLNTSLPVGTSAGALDVSASGGASYTIPISLPPGTKGVVPSVTIGYNSQGGNGIMGMGWNLGAVSAITRTGKNFKYDGVVTPINNNYLDLFALDGNRLELTSATYYDQNGATYATKMETFAKITYSNSSFLVEAKNGMVYEYGKTTDALLKTGGGDRIMAWYLNKASDQYGNYIIYEYEEIDREIRLKEIRYTGNDAAGIVPYNKAKFNYLERADKKTMYSAWETIKSNSLLSEIVVTTEGDQQVKKYQFSYAQDEFKHSFLREVFEYGSITTQAALNSTIFKYKTVAYTMDKTPALTLDTGYEIAGTGDYNGDGLTDFMAVSYFYHTSGPLLREVQNLTTYLRKSDNTGYDRVNVATFDVDTYASPSSFSSDNTDTGLPQTQDFNGDGKDDILIYFIIKYNNTPAYRAKYSIFSLGSNGQYSRWANSQFPNSLTTGDIYYTGSEGTFSLIDPQNRFVTTGDFDGDGITDILATLGKSDDHLLTAFILIRPNQSTQAQKFCFIGSDDDNSAIYGSQFSVLGASNVDADGKQELIYWSKFSSTFFNIKETRKVTGIMPSTSSTPTNPKFKFQSLQYFNRDYEPSHGDFRLGDFNGDGNTDIVYKNTYANSVYYEFSTGKTYVAGATIVFPSNLEDWDVGDFNGDGLADIVCSYKQCTYYYPYPECVTRPEGCSSTNCKLFFDVYYNTGTGTGNSTVDFVKKTYENAYYDVANGNNTIGKFMLGDFNSDGKTDILCGFNQGYHEIYSFNPNGNDYLLDKVQNGFMQTTQVSYKSLTESGNHYTRSEPSAYPLNVITAPIKVVASVINPNGIGGITETTYKYANARLHRAGLGFLGFGKFEVSNALQNAQSVTEYEILTPQYLPAVKKVTSNQLTGTPTLLSQTINTNNVNGANSGRNVYWLEVLNSVSTNGLTGATSTSIMQYSHQGLLTYSDVDINGEERTKTWYSWQDYDRYGNPKYVHSEKTRTGAPMLPSSVKNIYTHQGDVLSQERMENWGEIPKVTNEYNTTTGVLSTTTITATGLPSKTTSFEYNVKFRYATKNTNPLGQYASKTYDPRWGTVKTETDVAGLTTTYDYDGFGRVIKVTTPQSPIITTKYNWATANGTGLPTQCYTVLTNVPGKPTSWNTYDAFGRKTIASYINYGNVTTTTTTTYNATGNVYTTTTPTNPSEVPETTIYTYDGLNRLLNTSNSMGTTTYGYAFNAGKSTVSVTNPAGQTSSKTTDASGKVVSTTDYGGTLTFDYDSRSKQTAVKLGGVVISSMTYDYRGFQTSLTDKNAGTTNYENNHYGEMIWQRDANNSEYTLTYDILGRVLTRTGAERTTTNEYGAFNTNGVNQIKKVTGFGGANAVVQEYVYDNWQRVTQSSETIDGTTYGKGFTYRNLNNDPTKPTNDVETVKYPSGLVAKNTYTQDGYLNKVTASENGGTEKVLFDATNGTMNGFGKWKTYTLGNGVGSDITYNSWGMPSRFRAGGGTVQDLTLGWDLATGNLFARWDRHAGISKYEGFDYDNLNRLTAAYVNVNNIKEVTYYANGNLNTKTDVGIFKYEHPTKVNAVTGITLPTTPVMPMPISYSQQDVVYTKFKRPDKITEGSYEMTFMYAADYERRKTVLKQNGNVIDTRLYMGDYEIDTKNGLKRQIHYISGGDGICSIVIREVNGSSNDLTYYFPYTDHLGSILTVTDANGTIIAEQNFDAWGRKRNFATLTYDNIPAVPDWLYRGFTGHEHLLEFGLINMNARLYDPVLGRMLSPDNFVGGDGSQGFNRYSYAGNNPLNRVDPSGNVWHIFAGALIGAGFELGRQLWTDGKVTSLTSIGIAALSGGVGAAVGMPVGAWAAKAFTSGGPVIAGAIAGAVTGAASGAASGFTTGFLYGKRGNDLSNATWGGAKSGAIFGAIGGAIGGARAWYANRNLPIHDPSNGGNTSGIDGLGNRKPVQNYREGTVVVDEIQQNGIVNDPIAEGWIWDGTRFIPNNTPTLALPGSDKSVLHHILPKAFRSEFNAFGIDVDDYTVRIPRTMNGSKLPGGIHYAPNGTPFAGRGGYWNAEWKTFLGTNPTSASEIFKFAEDLMRRNGITGPYVRYK